MLAWLLLLAPWAMGSVPGRVPAVLVDNMAPNASDAADCGTGSAPPCLTIRHGVSRALAGATVTVRGGRVYRGECGTGVAPCRGMGIEPLAGASLTVQGVGGAVIDCEGRGRAFRFNASMGESGGGGGGGGGGGPATWRLAGLEIRNGCAPEGGAIFAGGGTLELDGCTLADCTARATCAPHAQEYCGGGGLFTLETRVVASRTAFVNCSVSDMVNGAGGGAFVKFTGSATGLCADLSACNFTDSEGGAGGGGAYILFAGNVTNATVSVRGSRFANTAASGPPPSIGGGGLFVGWFGEHNEGATTHVRGCAFERTSTAFNGGGALVYHATFARRARTLLEHCSFDGTAAGYCAGGADVRYFAGASATTTRVSGCSFTGTSADNDGNGGGLEILHLTRADSTTAIIEGSTFRRTTSGEGAGGALVVYDGPAHNTSTSILNTTFSSCTSGGGLTGGGGAQVLHTGPVTADAALLVDGAHFEGNVASGGIGGGGLYVHVKGAASGVSLAVQNSSFSRNTAAGVSGGGGLLVNIPHDQPQNLRFIGVNDSALWRNQSSGVPSAGAGDDDLYGPIGQYPMPHDFDMAYNPCSGCGAYPNGCSSCPEFKPAVYSLSPYPIIPIEGVYRRWQVSNTIAIRGSRFAANHAHFQGGAIAVPGGGSGSIESTVLEGNGADVFGGGIFVGGTVAISIVNSSLRENRATQSGSQLFSTSGAGIDFERASTVELGCGDGTSSCTQGFAAAQTGNIAFDHDSAMSCAPGFQLLNSSVLGFSVTLDTWQLKPPSVFPPGCALAPIARAPGHHHPTPFNSSCQLVEANSNCPCFFSTNPYGGYFSSGFGNATYLPSILVSTISYKCRACPVGRFNAERPVLGAASGTAGIKNTTIGTCAPCPAGHYQDSAAQRACIPCLANSHQSMPGQKRCDVCPGGRFQPQPGQADCIETCPLGIDCTTGIARQLAGWWRPAGNLSAATTLYACLGKRHCMGSDARRAKGGCTGAAGESCMPTFHAQCDEGYSGPVCALCAPGYLMQAGMCQDCSRLSAADITGFVLLALAIIALCLVVRRHRDSHWLDKAIVKIVLGFYQLVSIMERTFTVDWPASFRAVMLRVKLALASVADLPSAACAFEVNWFERLYVWTLGMMLAALVLWYRHHRLRSGGLVSREQLQHNIFHLAFFFYPLVTPVIVSVFDCRSVDGVSYVEADFTLQCTGNAWALAATWAALWTVGFVAGFPIAMALALGKRGQGHEAAEFLAGDYADARGTVPRMWEVVDTVKKLLLTSVILAVPQTSAVLRIGFALLVSVTFQMLQVYYKPYNSVHKNRVADAANAALSLMYFTAMMIAAQPAGSSASSDAIYSAVLIALLLGVAVAAYAALLALRRQVKSLPPRIKREVQQNPGALRTPLLPDLDPGN